MRQCLTQNGRVSPSLILTVKRHVIERVYKSNTVGSNGKSRSVLHSRNPVHSAKATNSSTLRYCRQFISRVLQSTEHALDSKSGSSQHANVRVLKAFPIHMNSFRTMKMMGPQHGPNC
jgi:hypothetical protein